MDCWTVLQLADDADERTIKRTYARLLKSCRPDDDAEGFQRLREAYEQALNSARWRAENDDEDAHVIEAPVAELAHADRNERTESFDVRPVSPAPFDPPAEQTRAQALINGLGAHNLDERWEQAQHQLCADAFQAALLRHCFNAPGERASIAAWAVQHLEWLTPWQRVSMSPWQHETLSGERLQAYRQALQEQLEQKAEREFVNQLKAYNQQPWLRVFDLQQQWQRIVLQLLHDSTWSVPLFERVCQTFGWDDQKGVHPEPAWMWRTLVERCEQQSFYDNLLEKAQNGPRNALDTLAARLLLTPMSTTEQHRLTSQFGADQWNACQQLSEKLAWRYPSLLERLPQPDVFFWRKFLPRPVTQKSWARVWGGLAIATCLASIHLKKSPVPVELVMFMLLTFLPATVAIRATQAWAAFTSCLRVADLWLSERVLPKRVNPRQYWLVLRHGVPQVGMLWMFGFVLGLMGMLTYLGMILIHLFSHRRMGEVDESFNAKWPWISGLHWSYWSPWQLVFLVVMVVVTLACQLYLPGFPLTRLIESRL
ncbi:J domain-containing protein [Pseudomonas antarctica]|uniref:J domain-containing protein n=1 Tax=Pseudomonas antarctica TaxID=219572 RepID=UPI00387B1408